MIEFVGWELPVEYSGIIPEHMAVRTKAGLLTSATWARSWSRARTPWPTSSG
jgi:glycine cleavage system aminomethyltransferase T